uniref:C2H2-type domain-containing protein n=1 Tax=Calidris pygmaea TaxID=425635 RepID=A0A8C3IZ30_9CHAR
MTPSNDGNSESVCEENEIPTNKDKGVKYCEEKCVSESVCNRSKSPLNDQCDTTMDECPQNDVLPTSPCKAEFTEINETSDRKECDGDDGFQKIPPLLFPAGNEGGGETIEPSTQVASAAISEREEELVNVASVLSDGSQEKQPEIQKVVEIIVEMGGPDSSKNGDNEGNNRKRKRSKFENEALASHLEHSLKEEPEFTYDCSAPFLNGCSSTSEELLNDVGRVGKLEMNASTSAESNTTGEHISKTLTPFSKKRNRQQKVVFPHASSKELQSQQEGLAWLSNSITIKPLSKASRSGNKNERLNLKCRFCSSVYKCSARLKKHVYSAHKDKKIHKCRLCKRTFFFPVNLKNHLKFHKKLSRLQKARKNRINARKARQRKTEERKSEAKKKESKYEKFFIKIERDFTPLDVPVSFSCKICFFASSNPRTFIHHMKGHKERPPYQCPQCDYSCISLSYLLNHMYWHAGYKLYQCRFCTFFSLYFASMVRHSYIHTEAKPYTCECCPSAFSSITELERHRRLHAGKATCQGQQSDVVSRRKRTQRPLKSYTCDECNVVFYTREHLSFHKKFHEQLKATAKGYTNQNNKYQKGKVRKVDSDSQDNVTLSAKKKYCLRGGTLTSDLKRAGDVQNDKKMCSRKNLHGSNSIPVIGNRSGVPLNSVIWKEEPLFNSGASHSQVEGDDAYHRFVENLKDTWPSNLSMFKMYKCQHCRYATAVHRDFQLHLKIHTDVRPFVCKECNKTFKTSKHLQEHKLFHIKNGYDFGHCLYVGRRLKNLELHREMYVGVYPERDLGSSKGSKRLHSLLGLEVCRVQPGVQKDRENDLLAQSQSRFYQCAECEYATCRLNNLELHVRTHTGEKPYSCSVCQKKFRTSSHLKRHGVTHFNVEHLKCSSCDYSTNKWPSLKQHLASHSHEEGPSAGCFYEQMQLPFKMYRCEECGYSTAHNGNLKLHLRIHTGEKPFKCDRCPVAFRTSSHLKRHLLTHAKLCCRRCKFSTVNKCALQKHVKRHTKKYECGKCNVRLPTKKLLEKHKRQHNLGI